MVPTLSRLRAALGIAIFAIAGSAAAINCKTTETGNNAPVAVDDTIQSVSGGLTVYVLANDYDVDPGDSAQLQISSVTTPAHGTTAVSFDHKSITYTPADSTLGDQFSYTIIDPLQHAASATVWVNAGASGTSFTAECTGVGCLFTGHAATLLNLRDYTWTWGDGTPDSVGGIRSFHQFSIGTLPSKTFPVTLTVNYTTGERFVVTQNVVVSLSRIAQWSNCCNDPNNPAAHTGLYQTFTMDSSEANNFPSGTSFAFQWDDGTQYQFSSLPPYIANYGFLTPGVKVIGLIASEPNNGPVHRFFKNIPVYNIPPAPDIQATVSSNGKTFTFDPTHSWDEWHLDTWGADIQPNPYEWDFGDGTYDIRRAVPGSLPDKVPHTYRTPGSYIVKLKLTDNVGESRTYPRQFEVSNLPPVPVLGFTCHGLTCAFDASHSTDPDNDVASYSWSFGDGTTSTAASPQKTFAAAGCYTVALTVRDTIGLPATVSRTVSLSGPRLTALRSYVVDAHASVDTKTNLNGLIEPGETVLLEPTWTTTPSVAPASGTIASIDGTASTALHVLDGNATYDVSHGVADCWTLGDCYLLSLDNITRPAFHWDIAVREQTASGVRSSILHVGRSFNDVQPTDFFYTFAEAALHNGVTAGCGNNNFCPGDNVDRASMAIWLLRSKFGPAYLPPACTTDPFIDAPCSQWYGSWVGDLKARGITSGCSANSYCPANPVTRAEMAVFILRTLGGPTYTPPPCSQDFTDVPCTTDPATKYWAADYISELKRRGITGGCSPTTFCPADSVTRAQMSVFTTVAFGLQIAQPQCPIGTVVLNSETAPVDVQTSAGDPQPHQ